MLQAQIFIDKDELKGSQLLYEFIFRLLIHQNITGVTAFKGSIGYGPNQRINKPNSLFSFDETPMLITFIDADEKVIAALTALRHEWKGGCIITNKVEPFSIKTT